jgi:hypothetical protein
MLSLLAQTYTYTTTTTSSSSSFNPVLMLVYAAILVVFLVSMWMVFEKAGEKGWKSIVPFYNSYILVKISGKPGWWFLLLLVPLVNIVVSIIVYLELAKRFSKSVSFAIFGLILFPYVGLPMLAFGNAKYTAATGTAPAAPTKPAAPAPPAAA